MKWIHLAVGSVAGGFSRYFLNQAVQAVAGPAFPWGIFIVNSTGCLAIGFLNAIAESKFMLDHDGRVLLMAGFCGAFTTFSTWMLDSSTLMKDGHLVRAFGNIIGSVLVGFLLFRLGEKIGQGL